ncbi:MAG: MGDG synthase family glycosyltransferase [Mycoplasmatales bacterium]
MKIVILTASYGNGHNSVAHSIENMFAKHEHINILTLDPRQTNRQFYDFIPEYCFNKIISRYPRNFIIGNYYHFMYHLGSFHPLLSEIVKSNALHRTQLMLDEEQPDVVITVFPHRIKVGPQTKMPKIYTVITDYTFQPLWADKQIDGYFVADPLIKQKLIDFGIDKERVFVVGIPVKPVFFDKAAEIKNNKRLLLTLGARGFMDFDYIINVIRKLEKTDFKVDIVCGANINMQNYLFTRVDQTQFTIHGFVNNMHELLKQSDIVITKAGGISISEAIASRTAMVINESTSFKGQEAENIQFVRDKNIGVIATNKTLIEETLKLLNDKERLTTMLENITKMSLENYHLKIDEIILEHHEKAWIYC